MGTRQVKELLVLTLQLMSDHSANFTQLLTPLLSAGDNGIVYPDDVGLPLFDTDNDKAVYIEIHYDNPIRISGMKDSSGVRIHYTHEQRAQEAAILQLGDPFVGLGGEKINDGLTQYEFNCPGTCSTLFLGGDSITVLSESESFAPQQHVIIEESILTNNIHIILLQVYTCIKLEFE